MEFPRRGGGLIFALVLLFGGPIFLVLPAAMWVTWVLSPLQHLYLPAYVASSFSEDHPRDLTTIRWVMKTAPKRKPEVLLPVDAEADPDSKLVVKLSSAARVRGWQGIVQDPAEKVHSAELAPYLRSEIFEGESAGWLIARPLLYALAAMIALYTAWQYFRHGSGRARAHEERHGRRTKGPELVSGLARFRRSGEDGIRLRMQRRGMLAGGSYRIPKRLESSHILLMGDTGSGKSSAIRQILRQVQERGESAIVYDPAMDFVGEFYNPERGDLILNPLDARCPWWDLRGEVSSPEIAMTIAAAMLPEKEYEKAFFTDGPRRVLARLLMWHPKTRDLLQWMSDPEEIEMRVKGTPQAALVDPAAPAQRAGVLSSLNMIADSLELLPEDHTKPGFRTEDWKFQRTRWVFLTSSAAYREKLLPLHSVWLDLFILRMMEPCVNEAAKPVWFVLDELASLNKLPQLHAAVTENRKYGNPVVMGLQGKSQMEKRYGQDAEAMLSQPATKIFLKTSEPRAAKWVSDAIGEIEIERLKESRSMELLGSKQSYAMEIATKPLVMPSEIAGLAPLHGFIKQENNVVPAHFELAKKCGKQLQFVERKREEAVSRAPLEKLVEASVAVPLQPPAPKRPERAVQPVANAPEAKKAVQSDLPLAEAPHVKKEGFAWDSSREIE
jgi:type IV secretory pathway TraG/TraD family ATPase VirD4